MENPIPKWVPHAVLTLIAIFFIIFGIDLLYVAYQINDPFSFVMTFFASNFIILISAALLLGFIFKIVASIKKERQEKGVKLQARD
jgi:uncharacterized membrane protein HdeD (DUF308 family)